MGSASPGHGGDEEEKAGKLRTNGYILKVKGMDAQWGILCILPGSDYVE